MKVGVRLPVRLFVWHAVVAAVGVVVAYLTVWLLAPRLADRRMTLEQLKRGPGNENPPAGRKWTVVGAKSEGITPGFTILDEKKQRYFIKFDPLSNPEMATAASWISFWVRSAIEL